MSKNRRLHEMILYVLSKQAMNRVKLGNLLFMADREAYLRLGRSISGATYWKRPWGAEPRNFGHILGALRRAKVLEIAASDTPKGSEPE